jgi:hypothetical protein
MRDDVPVPVRASTATVLTVRFLLELGALAGFAVGGAAVGSGVTSVLLAVLLPLAAAVMWGVWAAPKAPRRLRPTRRLGVEVVMFGGGALALVLAGHAVAGVAFALVAAVDTALIHAQRIAG